MQPFLFRSHRQLNLFTYFFFHSAFINNWSRTRKYLEAPEGKRKNWRTISLVDWEVLCYGVFQSAFPMFISYIFTYQNKSNFFHSYIRGVAVYIYIYIYIYIYDLFKKSINSYPRVENWDTPYIISIKNTLLIWDT